MLSGIFGGTKPRAPQPQPEPPKPQPKDIFEACEKGDLKAVKAFHNNGVDLNKVNYAGWLPIHYACYHRKFEVVKYLVEEGSEVNRLTDSIAPYSPLYITCSVQDDKIAGYLLDHGALPNQKLFKGLTVLHLLNTEKNLPCIRDLISSGALVGSRDDYGRTPLHSSQSWKVSRALIKSGSPANVKDNQGMTPGQHFLLREPNGTNNLYAIERDQEQWEEIEIEERNADGKFSENSEKAYLFDNETSDIYSVEKSISKFRAKALAVVGLALPFAIKATFMNIVKIVSDIALGIWNSIKAFSKQDWAASLKKIALSIVWDAPSALVSRIYRAIRAPLFATAMLFTALYAIYNPIEGRKTLNMIEEKWNEPGLLEFATLKKIGNVATSEINGYARFRIY